MRLSLAFSQRDASGCPSVLRFVVPLLSLKWSAGVGADLSRVIFLASAPTAIDEPQAARDEESSDRLGN